MYEKQMELFEDGGLRDEGGMVDEESGNEVPVGSTRKEVRDDIPAMLSEGEFVFPADVVRYIGLENLMRIRQDAKQGLKQMEAMGQMGNGDEATLPDDMPFGMMDLIIIEGEEEEEEPQKKAHGGVIHANQGSFIVPKFDPYKQDVRQFENAEGKTLNIPFLGGNPVYPIPEGYFPVGQVPEKDETKEAIPTSDDDDGPTTPAPKGYDWNTDTSATDGKALQEWIDNATQTSTFGNVAIGIAMGINPLLGGAMALASKRDKKQIINMLDEKIAQAKKTPIEGQVDSLEKLKQRLTTKEGKGILAKVLDEIVGTVTDALGLSKAEKATAKVGAGLGATQNTGESDKKTTDTQQKVLNELAAKGYKLGAPDDAVPEGAFSFGDLEPTSSEDILEAVKTIPAPETSESGEQLEVGPAAPVAPETPEAIPTAMETRAAIAAPGDPDLRLRSTYDEIPATRTDIENALAEKSTAPEAPQIATPAGLRGPKLGEGDIEQTDIDMIKYDTTSFYNDKKRRPMIPTLGSIEGEAIKQPKFEAPIPPQYQELRTVLDDLRESTAYHGPVSGMTMQEKLEDPLGPLIGAGKFQDLTNKVAEAVKPYATDRKPKPPTVPTESPKPSSGGGDDDDGPSFAPTPTSTQTEEEKEKTDTAVEKARETLTSGQRAGSAELDKTFGISGLKSGGLASRRKKK